MVLQWQRDNVVTQKCRNVGQIKGNAQYSKNQLLFKYQYL